LKAEDLEAESAEAAKSSRCEAPDQHSNQPISAKHFDHFRPENQLPWYALFSACLEPIFRPSILENGTNKAFTALLMHHIQSSTA
jgi:hypothetical protein